MDLESNSLFSPLPKYHVIRRSASTPVALLIYRFKDSTSASIRLKCTTRHTMVAMNAAPHTLPSTISIGFVRFQRSKTALAARHTSKTNRGTNRIVSTPSSMKERTSCTVLSTQAYAIHVNPAGARNCLRASPFKTNRHTRCETRSARLDQIAMARTASKGVSNKNGYSFTSSKRELRNIKPPFTVEEKTPTKTWVYNTPVCLVK